MRGIVLLLLAAAASATAQNYVQPYSLSLGMTEKCERKAVGPMVTTSPYSFGNAPSIGLNYRTPQDRVKLGITYSHTIQTGTNTVSAEIRYNILQWGKRQAKAPVAGPNP